MSSLHCFIGELMNGGFVMTEPRVLTTEPMTVAFVEMSGSYSQTPEGFGLLYGWIAQHGLTPAGMPAAVYLTMPSEVPESQARWELWAPVGGDPDESVPDAVGVGIRRVPATLAVSATHMGPYETVEPTYRAVWEFMAAEGYAPAGPPMERYLSDPAEVPPEKYLTEILIPVSRP